MAGRRRNVIREHEFEEQLAALICNDEEADDYVNAAEYILADDPTLGSLASAGPPEIWKLGLPPVRDRAVMLFYTFNESVVVFLYVVAYD